MPRRAALLAATVAVALVAPPAGAHAAGAPLYVALGDSYTSGPLIPNQHGTPIDCGRSDHNYPSVAAAALGLRLRDVSCGSATTEHMEHPQTGLPLGGTNPPQFDALTPDADVVTVGIGGNDAGLVGVAESCVLYGAAQPTGHACRDHYTREGSDEVGRRIASAAPKIAAVLQGIHARSPNARVLIVGYPAAAPTDGRGCYPMVPVSADDLAFIDEEIVAINAMIAREAAANDAEYVDTYRDSIGHDACTLPPTRWFEGVVPTEPAFPLHPNVKGEASMGRSLIAMLRRPAPPRVPSIAAIRVTRAARTAGPPAVVAFTVDRPAAITITVLRHGHRVGTVRLTATAAGEQRVRLTRRLVGRRAGRLRLVLRAVSGAHAAPPVDARVRIAR